MGIERRKDARHDRALRFNVRNGGGDLISAETINISAHGLYCKANKRIPLYSKLRVLLDLPWEGGNEQIDCEGVVVRIEEDADTSKCCMAIYFLNIDETSAERLSGYLGIR